MTSKRDYFNLALLQKGRQKEKKEISYRTDPRTYYMVVECGNRGKDFRGFCCYKFLKRTVACWLNPTQKEIFTFNNARDN
jgi:hypothetical protein